MAAEITDRARELLSAPNFAHVATLREDGHIHGVLVWVDVEDDRVVLNSAEGRAWPNNVQRDPRISLTVPNGENPYETVNIRGRVVEVTNEDADDHIDAMAMKYLGQDSYPFRQEGEVRVKIVVEPESVSVQGG